MAQPNAKLNFVTFARVSSREQEREGYSLDAQNKDMQEKAKREGWNIVKSFSFAESAKNSEARKNFMQMIDYVRKNRRKMDGILFHKTDRAARDLRDYILLDDLGVQIKFCREDYPETAAGRMSFAMMVVIARYYVDNLREEVIKGLEERACQGWFPGRASYGYVNLRLDTGQSIIVPDEANAPKVVRIFELYATGQHTLDSLRDELYRFGIYFTDRTPRFGRTTVDLILKNPFYIGKFRRNGRVYDGKHPPLISLDLWEKVQQRFSGKQRTKRDFAYGHGLIHCGHCSKAIVGELAKRRYAYYRCARYHKPYVDKEGNQRDHPRIRVPGKDMDNMAWEVVSRIRIQDPKDHAWFKATIEESHKDEGNVRQAKLYRLEQRVSVLKRRTDTLYTDRLDGRITPEQYDSLNYRFRQEIEKAEQDIEKTRNGSLNTDLCLKALELSQTLPDEYLSLESAQKRRILKSLCLNLKLDGVSLVPTYRKPFDVLAEGPLIHFGRGDCLRTTPNIVLHDFLTANSFEFDWSTFDRYAAFKHPKQQRRARYNGTTFQLRRQGYFTVGQICEAAGVPDSTFRDWEGLHFPSLPKVDGVRALSKDRFNSLVARCKELDKNRKPRRKRRVKSQE